jgi:hypothetical protein
MIMMAMPMSLWLAKVAYINPELYQRAGEWLCWAFAAQGSEKILGCIYHGLEEISSWAGSGYRSLGARLGVENKVFGKWYFAW